MTETGRDRRQRQRRRPGAPSSRTTARSPGRTRSRSTSRSWARRPARRRPGCSQATQYLKDNRLLPRGFDKGTAAAEIAVVGAAADDDDFVGGGDRVRYRVRRGTTGRTSKSNCAISRSAIAGRRTSPAIPRASRRRSSRTTNRSPRPRRSRSRVCHGWSISCSEGVCAAFVHGLLEWALPKKDRKKKADADSADDADPSRGPSRIRHEESGSLAPRGGARLVAGGHGAIHTPLRRFPACGSRRVPPPRAPSARPESAP